MPRTHDLTTHAISSRQLTRPTLTRASLAILAAAGLAVTLAACSGGEGEDPAATTEATEAAPPAESEAPETEQSVEEACAIVVELASPGKDEFIAEPVPGEIPDFAGRSGALRDALAESSEQVNNPSVNEALDSAVAGMTEFTDILAGIDYSGIDPNASDAVAQAQALNVAAFEAAGSSVTDALTDLNAVGTVCPEFAE